MQRDIRDGQAQRKEHMGTQLEACKPRREASEEITSADTLNLDFQAPEL